MVNRFLISKTTQSIVLGVQGISHHEEVMREGPSMYFPGTDDLCGDYCHGLDIVSPGSSLLICKHRHR
ncbi:hypothetical protein F2Q70_00027810 [Brassica cretica]|uniref:Uncharacterized protein n=1 Tax=Brassica cretica TaxID=69181 RepID=A0A8S9LC09_BRACR|nr:hypothetical protein F2Q70_00027810 [Brassica cretica]KAF3579215.1 hypothetical protein DY000_02034316 [Brassica cretica]